ncbi:MAG: hypothetical protein ACRCTF_00360 [Bacteroidales bacterium]
MMKGIDKIKEYLGEFKSNYVIIGGTAANLNLELQSQRGRVTKDIDMIVICEAINADYVESFWQFIKSGGYQLWQVKNDEGESRSCFYRFINPTDENYPEYIELFSRKPDAINLPEDAHLVHIPTDEYLSSFSAILMDDDYYNYAISHSVEISGVMSLDVPSLLALKAKAYLNNRQRKLDGAHVQSDDINKHKKDIYRLSFIINEGDSFEVPNSIAVDLNRFCELLLEEPINAQALSKYMAAPVKTMEQIVEQIKSTFGL